MKLLYNGMALFTVPFLQDNHSQALWCQDPFTYLKIIGDPKKIFFMWVLDVDIYLF